VFCKSPRRFTLSESDCCGCTFTRVEPRIEEHRPIMDYSSPSDCPLPADVVEDLIEGTSQVRPSRLLLFGSATNLGLEANDIDLLVLSEEFKQIRFDLRRSLLDFPDELSVDTWLYTPVEFEEIYSPNGTLRRKMEEDSINLLRLVGGN
jgi:hypothetical protein